MIICGTWFCVENKKKKLKHYYKVSPHFQWSEQKIPNTKFLPILNGRNDNQSSSDYCH